MDPSRTLRAAKMSKECRHGTGNDHRTVEETGKFCHASQAMASSRPRSTIARFLTSEAAGGIVLMAAAAIALILANSPLAPAYHSIVEAHVSGIGIVHAVNDGLMALFFLLVGLEIKRELVAGELSAWPKRILPGVAAIGGMLVPAIIYAAINVASPETLRAWAIPSATDIAFSLAVLSLLGSRVPASLKIFLTALAIIDDLGAILIIALFYTADLAPTMLLLAGTTFLALVALNLIGVRSLTPYLVVGALLWFFVLKSGIHATIAGVLLAATIPMGRETAAPPLIKLEQALHGWVAFGVVPLFGFVNAGVALTGLTFGALLDPVSLGVAVGLFAGKQIGVFGSVWLAIRADIARYPAGARASQVYGTALLCGIGFTMSLFIGLLAFPRSLELQDQTKIGVLIGSVASAVAGALVLFLVARKPARKQR